MAERNGSEEQEGLMENLPRCEITMEKNEGEQKSSYLFAKKSECATNEHSFPVSSMEEPKQSTEIEGNTEKGDLMESILLREIIVERNEAVKKGNGLYSLPEKANEEETNVHIRPVVELCHDEGKTHEPSSSSVSDNQENEHEEEENNPERIYPNIKEESEQDQEIKET